MSDFGNRLLLVIENSGLNKQDFARITRVSKGSISLYCSGKGVPGMGFLTQICKEFKVDLNWLLTGVGTSKSSFQTGDGATSNPFPMLPEEKLLIHNYRQMNKSNKLLYLQAGSGLAKPVVDKR